jgi:hypothetical protein
MTLIHFFKEVVKALKAKDVEYALAGGLVASLYRENERTTNDLDFLIFSEMETQKIASTIIKQFALEPHIIRKADLEGGPLFAIKRKNTTPYIIAGRADQKIGLDFILPTMPWFEEAIRRAKLNQIDFGFGPIPCLTKEDVIISKLYALRNDSSRFNDLDDLKSILKSPAEIDMAYICGQMQKLNLSIPESLKNHAPKPMLLTSKRVRRLVQKSGF